MMLSQTQNTASTKGAFIPESQVTELYNIVKQNEHLKDYVKRLKTDSEKVVLEAEKRSDAQKDHIKKLDGLIQLQSEELKKTVEMYGKQIDVKNLLLVDLNNQLQETVTDGRKTARKKFWDGFAIGGISVVVLGAVAIIAMNQ